MTKPPKHDGRMIITLFGKKQDFFINRENGTKKLFAQD